SVRDTEALRDCLPLEAIVAQTATLQLAVILVQVVVGRDHVIEARVGRGGPAFTRKIDLPGVRRHRRAVDQRGRHRSLVYRGRLRDGRWGLSRRLSLGGRAAHLSPSQAYIRAQLSPSNPPSTN